MHNHQPNQADELLIVKKNSILQQLEMIENRFYETLIKKFSDDNASLNLLDIIYNYRSNTDNQKAYLEQLQSNKTGDFLKTLNDYQNLVAMKISIHETLNTAESLNVPEKLKAAKILFDDAYKDLVAKVNDIKLPLARKSHDDVLKVIKSIEISGLQLPSSVPLESEIIHNLNPKIERQNEINDLLKSQYDKIIPDKIIEGLIESKDEDAVDKEIRALEDHLALIKSKLESLEKHKGDFEQARKDSQSLSKEAEIVNAEINDFKSKYYHDIANKIRSIAETYYDSAHTMIEKSKELVNEQENAEKGYQSMTNMKKMTSNDPTLEHDVNTLFKLLNQYKQSKYPKLDSNNFDTFSNDLNMNRNNLMNYIDTHMDQLIEIVVKNQNNTLMQNDKISRVKDITPLPSQRELDKEIERLKDLEKRYSDNLKHHEQRKLYLTKEKEEIILAKYHSLCGAYESRVDNLGHLKAKFREEIIKTLACFSDLNSSIIEKKFQHSLSNFEYLAKVEASGKEYLQYLNNRINPKAIDNNVDITNNLNGPVTLSHKYKMCQTILQTIGSIGNDAQHDSDFVKKQIQATKNKDIILTSHRDTLGTKLLAVVTLGLSALLRNHGIWKPQSKRLHEAIENDSKIEPPVKRR